MSFSKCQRFTQCCPSSQFARAHTLSLIPLSYVGRPLLTPALILCSTNTLTHARTRSSIREQEKYLQYVEKHVLYVRRAPYQPVPFTMFVLAEKWQAKHPKLPAQGYATNWPARSPSQFLSSDCAYSRPEKRMVPTLGSTQLDDDIRTRPRPPCTCQTSHPAGPASYPT